ncbi:MAG TPA: hypothetical protein DCY07_02900 [Rhodospirillaceae bacterium]|nr:hypothetical protein [Rhodospirillaceae bacterium]
METKPAPQNGRVRSSNFLQRWPRASFTVIGLVAIAVPALLTEAFNQNKKTVTNDRRGTTETSAKIMASPQSVIPYYFEAALNRVLHIQAEECSQQAEAPAVAMPTVSELPREKEPAINISPLKVEDTKSKTETVTVMTEVEPSEPAPDAADVMVAMKDGSALYFNEQTIPVSYPQATMEALRKNMRNEASRVAAECKSNMLAMGRDHRRCDGYKYPPYINEAIMDYDGGHNKRLYESFAHLVQVESSGRQFNKDGTVVLSGDGAVGISQILPSTAKEQAKELHIPYSYKRLCNDMDYNLLLGFVYYKKQYEKFGGDRDKAYAAYNAGPSRMSRVLRYVARIGKPEDWLDHTPGETIVAVGRLRKLSEKANDGLSLNAKKFIAEQNTPERGILKIAARFDGGKTLR